ncbi:MAG: hypothetical protein JKX95_08125 [Bacteroidia bacterium]|nr:hypothetical protein [Bacteroidia bacterium]
MKSKIQLTTKLYGLSAFCCCICFSLMVSISHSQPELNEIIKSNVLLPKTQSVLEKVELRNATYLVVFSKELKS